MAAPAQWQAWAADADAAVEMPDYKPALAFLPAMQRRRLGDSARRVLDAAWDLASDYPDAPLVYVSHDGEINRSFELWLGLLRDNEVSPTSFGLSVHNALAGQWSMLRGDMGENTALAVRGDLGLLAVEAGLCGGGLLLEQAPRPNSASTPSSMAARGQAALSWPGFPAHPSAPVCPATGYRFRSRGVAIRAPVSGRFCRYPG